MNEIEHEGKTYILKSQVEAIIKDRVSKVAARANEAESQLKEATSQIESMQGKQASLDMLTEQIQNLKGELAASENKFNRYQSMSKHGISDSELIEAIEWQYEKSMKGKSKKEVTPLSEWLENHLSNPAEAPIAIRPHLQNLAEAAAPSPAAEPVASPELADSLAEVSEPLQQAPAQPMYQAPQTNRGAVPAPEGKDILRKAMSDPEFYSANAEAVQKAWMARYSR